MSFMEQWKEKEKAWSGEKHTAENRKYLFTFCAIVRLKDTAEVKTDVEKRYYSVGSGTNKRSQSVSVYPIEFYYTGNCNSYFREERGEVTK